MLTLLLSVVISAISVFAANAANVSTGELVAYGLVGFFGTFFLIGFLIRKKTGKLNKELQEIMEAGQKRMNHKINQFQNKPGGNLKAMQRQMERDQKEIFKNALEFSNAFETYRKWSLLMGKQIATMRLQFLYQLKEFEKVDQIFSVKNPLQTPILMEPMPVAMKMARQFKNKQIDAAEKTFKRHVKWFKGDRGTLLYGLMSWIYMKGKETEKARLLLDKGKEVTMNETLARNWEVLTNRKEKQFSNSGLGDEWYGLYLENPPTPKQQRMRGNPHSGRRF